MHPVYISPEHKIRAGYTETIPVNETGQIKRRLTMKNTMIKKILGKAAAVLLSAALAFPALPAVPVYAYSYTYTPATTTAEVTNRLTAMANIYKGKRWGSESTVKTGDQLVAAVLAGYSDPNAPYSMAEREANLGLYTPSVTYTNPKSNNFYGNSQCHGFAAYMGFVLTGRVPNMGYSGNGYTCYSGSQLNNFRLRPGDLIRNKTWTDSNGKSNSVHTGVIWKVEGNRVAIVEANVLTPTYGSNRINWGDYGYHGSRENLRDHDNLMQYIRNGSGYVMRPNLADNGSVSPAPAQNDPSSLSISVTSAPVQIRVGEPYGLRGSIDSNYPVSEVIGRIINENGSVVQETHDYPNSKNINIRWLNANQKLYFDYLPEGYYKLQITARDGHAERTFEQSFTAGDPESSRRAAEEARKREEEAARKAAEEALRAAEEAARKAEEEKKRQEEAGRGIIIIPDDDDVSVNISGDTGAFEMHMCKSMTTSAFTAAAGSVTIITRGNVEDLEHDRIYTDAGKHFTMSLYDVTDGGERYVSGYFANCDDIEGGLEFNVQEGHRYKIRLSSQGLRQTEAVIGDGHVWPVR